MTGKQSKKHAYISPTWVEIRVGEAAAQSCTCSSGGSLIDVGMSCKFPDCCKPTCEVCNPVFPQTC